VGYASTSAKRVEEQPSPTEHAGGGRLVTDDRRESEVRLDPDRRLWRTPSARFTHNETVIQTSRIARTKLVAKATQTWRTEESSPEGVNKCKQGTLFLALAELRRP